MRFTLWFPCLFAICFVIMIVDLNVRWSRPVFLALAAACTMLNGMGVVNGSEITAGDFRKMLATPAGMRRTADLARYAKSGYSETWKIVPPEEPIGFCFPNNGCGYPLYDSDFSRRLEYIAVEDANFIESMRAKRIRFLFVERLSPIQDQIVQDAVRSNRLARLREYLYAVR